MNIFILSNDPYECARFMCDKHIVKMPVESGIMLSLAYRFLNGNWVNKTYVDKSGKTRTKKFLVLDDPNLDDLLYAKRGGYGMHICSVWTRETLSNYLWHYELFKAMSEEFHLRFGKSHGTWAKLKDVLSNPPQNISNSGLTPFAQAVGHFYDENDPIGAYRKFYIHDKQEFAKWDHGREEPYWWKSLK